MLDNEFDKFLDNFDVIAYSKILL